MPSDPPPVPVSATYASATRTLVLDFDRDLDTGSAFQTGALRISNGFQLFAFNTASYTGARQITATAPNLPITPAPPAGVIYDADPAWLRGLDGQAVAAFSEFPYTPI